MDQWSFTAPFEGIVPHLYLDSGGLLTCGVGFLVEDERELRRLPWSPNVQAAVADARAVKDTLHVEPGQLWHARAASAYRPLCSARLSEASMHAIFADKVLAFRRAIDPAWKLTNWPEPVQLALVDMAYNLGVGGLNKYRRLQMAVFARQWHVAADECARRGIQAARNEATRRLFLSAV